ncbi:MAG: hypothetical protein Kow00103_14500 [Candidatus Caldatribacteriota bacterium]
MKEIGLKKTFFMLIILACLALLTVGCSSIIGEQTGIVSIHVVSGMVLGKITLIDNIFNIYMDGYNVGTTDSSGYLVIPDVPKGWHNFEAKSSFTEGSKYQNIKPGMVNEVTIYVYPIMVL